MHPQHRDGAPGVLRGDGLDDGAVLLDRVEHLPVFDGQKIAQPIQMGLAAVD